VDSKVSLNTEHGTDFNAARTAASLLQYRNNFISNNATHNCIGFLSASEKPAIKQSAQATVTAEVLQRVGTRN